MTLPSAASQRSRQKSEHCSSSGQRVKTAKSTQWKKARGSCKMPEGSEENPRGAEDLASTSRAATANPKKLVDGYSAEASLPARRTKSRGDLRKHPQVKKRRRLNRSKNSLKEKHPRMMKEHQKCKKRIILV